MHRNINGKFAVDAAYESHGGQGENRISPECRQEILCRRSCPISVPVPANGVVLPCAVWYGGSPVSLDGAQAEKAIPGRADAGDGVTDRFLFGISRQQINIPQQSNCFGISDRL